MTHQDVVGLDVGMQHAAVAQVVQCRKHLGRVRAHRHDVQPDAAPVLLRQLPQVYVLPTIFKFKLRSSNSRSSVMRCRIQDLSKASKGPSDPLQRRQVFQHAETPLKPGKLWQAKLNPSPCRNLTWVSLASSVSHLLHAGTNRVAPTGKTRK